MRACVRMCVHDSLGARVRPCVSWLASVLFARLLSVFFDMLLGVEEEMMMGSHSILVLHSPMV